MKLEDEIKVVKADIRRLLSRRRYIENGKWVAHQTGLLVGLRDAIRVLEKYLKKIEKGTK